MCNEMKYYEKKVCADTKKTLDKTDKLTMQHKLDIWHTCSHIYIYICIHQINNDCEA